MSSGYYLKRNIVIEPLVARYRASAYLVSPCTAPRFLRHLVKRLLSSFVQSPRMHELALKNKAMQGGPFVGLRSEQANNAMFLYQHQLDKMFNLFQFADAQDQLWHLLKQAAGESLERHMDAVPSILKYFVELFYERSGTASYRMIEGLLYHSDYYRPDLQEVLMYPIDTDEREFALTTPHMESPDRLFLEVPFSSMSIDALSASRFLPILSIGQLAHDCGVSREHMQLFKSFFEKSNDECRYQTTKSHVESIRYYGHACVEVNSGKTTVLMDPLISYEVSSKSDNRLTFHDLPNNIDAVVISHLHLDHFCIETLLQLRHKIDQIIVPKTNGGTCIDPSAKWVLKALGFKSFIELDSCEQYQVGDITITALPFQGEHGCLDITSKSIFKITTPKLSYLFMADMRTTNQALLRALSKQIGSLDVLFVGMECEGAPVSWVYGCLLDQKIERQHDQERRLNGSNAHLASQIVNVLKPKYVRVYALGREPWLSHIMKVDMNADSVAQCQIHEFLLYCKKHGVHAKMLHINHHDQYANRDTNNDYLIQGEPHECYSNL